MLKYRIAFMLASLAAMDEAHAAGLCSASETTVFNCELKENHKIVSMCSSNHLRSRAQIPLTTSLACG
jgi:hypothetical protein